MRALLLVLILVVVVVIGAVATGLLNISQVRGARAPDINASGNGVTASGGHAPSFDVQTGSVGVGARDATIKVPEIRVNPPANQAAPAPQAPQAPQAPPPPANSF